MVGAALRAGRLGSPCNLGLQLHTARLSRGRGGSSRDVEMIDMEGFLALAEDEDVEMKE